MNSEKLHVTNNETEETIGDKKFLFVRGGRVTNVGNIDKLRVSDHGTAIVQGDVEKFQVSFSGYAYIFGDIKEAHASDHGTLYIIGNLELGNAQHSGSIYVTGDVNELKAEHLGSVSSHYKIPENIQGFLDRSLQKI